MGQNDLQLFGYFSIDKDHLSTKVKDPYVKNNELPFLFKQVLTKCNLYVYIYIHTHTHIYIYIMHVCVCVWIFIMLFVLITIMLHPMHSVIVNIKVGL